MSRTKFIVLHISNSSEGSEVYVSKDHIAKLTSSTKNNQTTLVFLSNGEKMEVKESITDIFSLLDIKEVSEKNKTFSGSKIICNDQFGKTIEERELDNPKVTTRKVA